LIGYLVQKGDKNAAAMPAPKPRDPKREGFAYRGKRKLSIAQIEELQKLSKPYGARAKRK
jgi:hypothetical protein